MAKKQFPIAPPNYGDDPLVPKPTILLRREVSTLADTWKQTLGLQDLGNGAWRIAEFINDPVRKKLAYQDDDWVDFDKSNLESALEYCKYNEWVRVTQFEKAWNKLVAKVSA
jgi:hypothetical protein